MGQALPASAIAEDPTLYCPGRKNVIVSSLEWSSRSIPALILPGPSARPAKPLMSKTEILIGLGALALVGAANLAVDKNDQPIYSNATTVAAKTATHIPPDSVGFSQTETNR